jgi:hypothetical protein
MVVCLALIALSGVMFVFGGSLAGLAILPLFFLPGVVSDEVEQKDDERDVK